MSKIVNKLRLSLIDLLSSFCVLLIFLYSRGHSNFLETFSKTLRLIIMSSPQVNSPSGRDSDSPTLQSKTDQSGPPGPPPKHGFFSRHLAEIRWKMLLAYFKAYFFMCAGLLAICSIYWGSYYKRESRAVNLTAYIVSYDGVNSSYLSDHNLQPYVGNALRQTVQAPELQGRLGWEVINGTTMSREHILHLIHEQHIWAAIFVEPNATETLHRTLRGENTNYNGTGLINGYYEQATDFLASTSVMQPVFPIVQTVFQSLATETIFRPLVQSFGNTTVTTSSSDNGLNLLGLTEAIQVTMTDRLPLAEPLLVAPLQVGLIYLIILSFFQFNFFTPIHMLIQPQLKVGHTLIYRWLSSQVGFFIVSLFFCLTSKAFQVDTAITFGKSGFLVFWMINFLAMSALGGATENVALIVFPIYPPVLGLWLLFWVIVNISPAFSPFPLLAKFFEYGYGFPVYNALTLIKVVLCNTTKRTMGRNFGVLIAWIALNTALFPFCLKFTVHTMRKKAIAAAQAAKAAEAKNKA